MDQLILSLNDDNTLPFRHFLLASEKDESETQYDGTNLEGRVTPNDDDDDDWVPDSIGEESPDEFVDKTSSRGDPSVVLAPDKKTKWRTTASAENLGPRFENVDPPIPSIKERATNANSIVECWQCLFDDDLLNIVVNYTNKYIASTRTFFSRERDAKLTDLIELKALIGLLYLAGVWGLNRSNTSEIWATDMTGIEIFPAVMSEKRFKYLLGCIRFDDQETQEARCVLDNVAPIRQVFDLFVNNCQNSYNIGEHVTIGEKLEHFRGQCAFRQYFYTNRTRYGIKIYAVVDSRIFYTTKLEIDTGPQPESQYALDNRPTEVVKRLCSEMAGTGRSITLNSRLTSLEIGNYLLENKLSIVGPFKKNNIPRKFIIKSLPEGSCLYGYNGKSTLISYVSVNKKNIVLLSTIDPENEIFSSESDKNGIITFYNWSKLSVDTLNQLCAKYDVARNTRKWPMVVFFSMLNIAGINSQIIYFGKNNKEEVIPRKIFLRKLALELVRNQIERRSKLQTLPKHLRGKLKKFLPEPQPDNSDDEASTSKTNKRRRCVPCGWKRQRLTKYCCKKCKNYICLEHSHFLCGDCSNKL